MTHLRKNSLRFKIPKPPKGAVDEDNLPQCSTLVEESKADKGSDDGSTLSRLLRESDLKRKKLTSKLSRLEELNKVIEERIKNMMYQPESYPDPRLDQSSTGRWRGESRSPLKGSSKRKKKEGPSPARQAKRQDDDVASPVKSRRKGETLAEFIKVENYGSNFSLEKVLGICRGKVQSMQCRREELLDAAPLAREQRLGSFDATSPDPSTIHADSALQVKETFAKKSKSPPGESHKHDGKAHGHHRPKPRKASPPQQDAESPKSRINEILKCHAQKVSSDSIKSGNRARDNSGSPQEGTDTPQKTRIAKAGKTAGQQVHKSQRKTEADDPKEGAPTTDGLGKSSSITCEKKYQKVIEIEQRAERRKEEECEEAKCSRAEEKSPGEKAEGEVKAGEEKPKQEENAPQGGQDEPPKPAMGKDKENGEVVKRVAYTDKLLTTHTARSDSRSTELIVAVVQEKLNSPFREAEKGRSQSAGGTSAQKSSLERTPSETLLLSSMIDSIAKQRGARPSATVREQGSKPGEQSFRTKSSRSTELKDLVAQAIKDHKIFCIFDNHWYIVRPVREELLNRGWLEVIPDRRMIPRRKPPPAGPTADRLTTADCTIEALLTAKEAFADDLTDVMRYPPTKISVEKSRVPRKNSEESLREAYSEFRIVPPTPEKKRNNAEIREFVTRYKTEIQEQEKKGGKQTEREKKSPAAYGQSEVPDAVSGGLTGVYGAQIEATSSPRTSVSPSLLAILDSISESRKTLSQMPEAEKGKERVDVLYNTTVPAKARKEAAPAPDNSSPGSKYSLTENESKIASKIIQTSNARIQFMWLSIKPAIHLKCFNYSPEIVNKFQKTTFCTKIGLWSHLNNIHWYAHEVKFSAKSPRMYNTGEADDLKAFFQDFQLTACIGILKWLSETFFDKGIKGVQKKKGKVPIKAFEFAIRQCERYIRFHENEDLNALEEPKVTQEEWNTFLQWFYVITNDHGKLQETSNAQLMVMYTKAVEVLRAMKRHWPEIDVDGRLNIWIMKPYCASCGRGIFMTNNVYYIGQHSKYIVQKYIERPLLIYNTKFDIRQWFMITKLIPLEIWMYKECYLRFCTQPFALRNLHESVHLSNNSVQRKYVSQRDPSLPDQNMWDSNTFRQYLKTIGQPNAWNEIIYPGMRDAIISIMLAAQDTFDSPRKSWFEVYGADFMISANLKDGPWLIEINENPAMDPSTKVTARLCPQMLRDVIKVIVDKRANKNALTGQWELVYRQNYSPSFGTIDIDVKGRRITRLSQSVKPVNTVGATRSPLFHSSVYSSGKRENSNEKDQDAKKQYEIVKSYNPKKGKGGSEDSERPVKSKQSVFRARGKARLLTDSENGATKSQKGGRRSG